MLKYFTFFIFIFAIQISFSQDLSATLNMPEVVSPGEDYTVEITIKKGAINSYIKFSQRLPPHFKATKIETNGGNFTFDDSIIKIVWLFPPANPEFSFSYKVSVPEDASGSKKIGGKIFYFYNTNREVFSFDKKIVNIGTATGNIVSTKAIKVNLDSVSNIPAEKEVMPVVTNTVVITTTDTSKKTIAVLVPVSKDSIKAVVMKDSVAASKIDLPIVVSNKDTLASKSIVVVPPAKDSSSASIVKVNPLAIKDTVSKLPIVIADKVVPVKDTTVASLTNINKLPVKDTIPKIAPPVIIAKIPVKDTMVTLQAPKVIVVKDTAVVIKVPLENKNFTKKDTVAIPKEIVKKEAPSPVVEVPEPMNEKINKTEIPAGNLTYCVQLGAYKEEVPLETANKYFKISAKGIKNFKDDNGVTTFLVGNFKTHDEAINLKNEMIEKGFQGAFIVSFPTNKTFNTSSPNKGSGNGVSNTGGSLTSSGNNGSATLQSKPSEKIEVNYPSAIPETATGKSYRVQIGAFKEEVPLETANKFLKMAGRGVKNFKDTRGYTVYTVGNFSNRDDAAKLKAELINRGFQGSFVVAFENGAIVK